MSTSHDDPVPTTTSPRDGVTRRTAIAAGVASAVALGAGAATVAATGSKPDGASTGAAGGARMPVVYLPHGGGPWPFVELGFGSKKESDALRAYLTSLPQLARHKPKAMLVVSAHWEEPVCTVMSGERPPLLFDYYGFPPESYTLTWPAPGEPALANRVRALLEGAGFETGEDTKRGYDHGTFVPLKVAYPGADVPVVQLSLKQGLDPAEHVKIGRALQPLRDEGVLIVGSGMSFHNMRGFGRHGAASSEQFDAWLGDTMALAEPERAARLADWARAPAARVCHPREEHLLPLMVIAGAAGADKAERPYNGTFAEVRLSAFHFG